MKYPRTYHLPFSPGASSDDKILDSTNSFHGKEIVVTKKMDGENTTMTNTKIYARSLDSIDHPSRHFVKGLHGSIKHEIPENWRICGENLYAKHSIQYENLPSYFLMFSIWDENNMCLSWDDTLDFGNLLGLKSVEVLYRGIYDENVLKNLNLNLDIDEGFCIRISGSFHYNDFKTNVAKWVRKNHVQTDDHWMFQKITPNLLAKL